jgi:hypothetical protein
MHEHFARFTATEGVLLVGQAQEKTKLSRTEQHRDANGDSYPRIVASTGLVTTSTSIASMTTSARSL